MTVQEIQSQIVSQIKQNAIDILTAQLAQTIVERDELKARVAELEKKPEPTP